MSGPIDFRRRGRLKQGTLASGAAAGARRTKYDGRWYDSKMEAGHAAILDMSRNAAYPENRVAEWRPQVTVPLDVNGVHICNYRVDFQVTYADGHEEWHEVKGFETELWIIKARLFRACYPERIYRVFR